MHFQFLVEDRSSTELINILMDKIVSTNPNVTFNCKGFRGIGGFTPQKYGERNQNREASK